MKTSALLPFAAVLTLAAPALAAPLHDAAKEGDMVAIAELLAAGADPDSQNKYGTTALHLVAGNGRVAAIWALLAAGADVNAKNKRGNTALNWAAGNGHVPAIEALLAAGADVHARDKYSGTSLHWAAGNGPRTGYRGTARRRRGHRHAGQRRLHPPTQGRREWARTGH